MAEPQQEPQSRTPQPGDAMIAGQADDATLNSQYDDDQTSGLDETVEANRGREQGLGMGARELNAQQDAGDDDFDSVEDEDEDDDQDEILDENVAVQGDDEEEENGGGV
ncbi:MAG TPA: hypothetical protein VGR32_08170 [Brevundimonas sp.]|jgi:hypothetical protein|uniref:hypothetical protein n=1 Tax=Brevundimonas sp. TaxID=1871086 RepID=UPI002DF18F3E|nr:hypothetical protein [Brevundimonas sp.]